MIILWLDPWTTDVGYGIIELMKNTRTVLTYGVIHTTPKAPQSEKVLEIGQDLETLIKQYWVTHAGLEKVFFATNLKTGIEVAQSRGVLLYILAKMNIDLQEYTPLQVKKALCGNGRANKQQVGKAVQLLYRLWEIPKPDDAADALGIAYLASMNVWQQWIC